MMMADLVITILLLQLIACGLCLAYYKPTVFFTISTLVISVLIGYVCKFSCSSHASKSSSELEHFMKNLRVGAHRGLAMDAPENTLAAIRLSKTMKSDLVEIDVSLTADDVAVLLHDDTVDRTTNGSGPISQMTFEQVSTLNAAANFGNGTAFGFEKVPTLEEAVVLADSLGLRIIIDVKRYHRQTIDIILSLYRRFPHFLRTVAVASFHPGVARAIKAAQPNIITGHTWCVGMFSQKSCTDRSRRFSNSVLHWLAVVAENIYIRLLRDVVTRYTGAELMLVESTSISRRDVDILKTHNVHVIVWTVNDVHAQQYYYNVVQCPLLTDTLVNFTSSN